MKKYIVTIIKSFFYVIILNIIMNSFSVIMHKHTEWFFVTEGIIFALSSVVYFLIKKRNTVKWMYPILTIAFEVVVFYILYILYRNLGAQNWDYFSVWVGIYQLLFMLAFLTTIDIIIVLIDIIRKKDSKQRCKSEY